MKDTDINKAKYQLMMVSDLLVDRLGIFAAIEMLKNEVKELERDAIEGASNMPEDKLGRIIDGQPQRKPDPEAEAKLDEALKNFRPKSADFLGDL